MSNVHNRGGGIPRLVPMNFLLGLHKTLVISVGNCNCNMYILWQELGWLSHHVMISVYVYLQYHVSW